MPRAKEPRHERRSHPSSLRPDRRHRQHAASADRVARRLGRLRQPRRAARRARHLASARAHGVQGHHAPHRAPDRRGDRGGRRRPQCRDQRRDHGLLRARAQGRRAARARRARPTSCPIRPSIRTSSRASRTSSCRRSAPTEDTPDDLVFDYLQAIAFPDQPIGRSILGTPRDACARSRIRHGCAPIWRATIAAPDMVVAAAGAVDHAAIVAEVERRFGALQRPGGAGAAAGALRRRHQARGARSRAGPHRARARRGAAARPEPVQPAGVHQRARRRNVVAAVPGGAREARPVLRDLRLPLRPIPTPACSASTPAPTRATPTS